MEALMKNFHLFMPQLFGFNETLRREIANYSLQTIEMHYLKNHIKLFCVQIKHSRLSLATDLFHHQVKASLYIHNPIKFCKGGVFFLYILKEGLFLYFLIELLLFLSVKNEFLPQSLILINWAKSFNICNTQFQIVSR